VGDMSGSDVRVSGEICQGECKLNWRYNLHKRKAAQATAEVGGVRSSDDPVPDLWFGELAGERRDATCSAGGSATKDVVTARKGYKRPKMFSSCKSTWRCGLAAAQGTRKAGCGKTACPV